MGYKFVLVHSCTSCWFKDINYSFILIFLFNFILIQFHILYQLTNTIYLNPVKHAKLPCLLSMISIFVIVVICEARNNLSFISNYPFNHFFFHLKIVAIFFFFSFFYFFFLLFTF